MDFSIVVPFFNAERFIERCARALMAQTFPAHRFEILMIDNNSTDASVRIVQKFDRVRLLHEPEQGSYAARNRGLQQARGRLIAFTDPDCEPRTDWLEQIERAMADPATALILGDRRFASDSGILAELAAYESALVERIFESRRVESYYAYTNNMAVRMSVAQKLGGFQKLMRGADTLFLRRVMEICGERAVRYAPGMLVRHLEIATVGDYLEKKRVYGRLAGHPCLNPPHGLPLAIRMRLAWRTLRRRGASVAAKLGYLGVLAAGSIRFEWERRRNAHAD